MMFQNGGLPVKLYVYLILMDILSVYIVISLFHSILLQQGPISFMIFVQSSYLMEILNSCKEIIGYVITANLEQAMTAAMTWSKFCYNFFTLIGIWN